MNPIFHLSLPVADLSTSGAFYKNLLGGRPGRITPNWMDVWLWGHQLTLQKQPDALLPEELHSHWHFGFILEWEEWEAEVARLQGLTVDFLREPAFDYLGTPKEQAKVWLRDPDRNRLELKAYRYPSEALQFELGNS